MALKPGQLKCINTLDEPLVVAAGAGSGKTFTLTKRIVNALTSGYVDDIDQVLAITFTKKAAGELKSRVKASLRDAGMIDQALKVDEAWISTIHGMCSRILRSNAVQLGIDPSFSVADDVVLREMRRSAVEVALEEMRDSSADEFEVMFSEYQASSFGSAFGSASVEDMVLRLVEKIPAQEDGIMLMQLGDPVSPVAVLDKVASALSLMMSLAEGQNDSASKAKFIAQAQLASEEIARLVNEGRLDAADALSVMGLLPTSCNFGKADFKETAKSLLGEITAEAVSLRLSAAQPLFETILKISNRAAEILDKLKHRAGVLSNDDLLLFASQAIANHPDIAASLEDKFKLIMIDEFQDTDQSQVDMIKRLAGPDASRLCVVGDAQQSIYRFRGADVSVYRRHLSDVQARNADDIIYLPDNFRSHRDVLSFVDRIFERDDMFGKEFMSLAPSRDEKEVKKPFLGDGARIVVRHVSYPTRGGTELMRLSSARAIAEELSNLSKAGHSAGDMVILLGTMSHADVYAAAVRDIGLSCVIAGGSVLKNAPETALIVSLLNWLANPACEDGLFGVLSSPLFGLTADELIEVATARRQNGSVRRRDLHEGVRALGKAVVSDFEAQGIDGAPLSSRLAQAVTVLRRARQRVGVSSVRSIVNDLLVESGWITRMQHQGEEGRASVANMYKLVRLVGEAEEACPRGSATLAERFASQVAGMVQAPGALSVSGGNFVRIMTIHASKGLEFPIVAVAEMKSSGSDSSALLLDSVDGRIFVSLDLGKSVSGMKGPVANVGKALDDALDEELLEDEIPSKMASCGDVLELRALMRRRAMLGETEEAKRLLYVALTRAKEALIVATFGNRTKDNANGAPKNAFSSIGPALTGANDWFAPGVTMHEFGGTTLARVQHVALEKDDAGDSGSSSQGSSDDKFAVPVDKSLSGLSDRVFLHDRRGIFSYTAVSDASHSGSLLADLASKHAVETSLPDVGVFGAPVEGDPLRDDAWLDEKQPADDRATDFGTAFHLLAQYAVIARGPGEALRMPPDSRIDAVCRQCGVEYGSRFRLTQALAAWFESDLAHDVATDDASLSAEVPFFVDVPDGHGGSVYLEGEIDLLVISSSNPKGLARVVDYKTGGNLSENDGEVRVKHVLQASCYAYALLRAGFDAVEATFVRVEQRSLNGQPQIVRYRFESRDQDSLAHAIAHAHAKACA